MAAEIEQLADRTGLLKFASPPGWMRVGFPVYKIETVAALKRGRRRRHR